MAGTEVWVWEGGKKKKRTRRRWIAACVNCSSSRNFNLLDTWFGRPTSDSKVNRYNIYPVNGRYIYMYFTKRKNRSEKSWYLDDLSIEEGRARPVIGEILDVCTAAAVPSREPPNCRGKQMPPWESPTASKRCWRQNSHLRGNDPRVNHGIKDTWRWDISSPDSPAEIAIINGLGR